MADGPAGARPLTARSVLASTLLGTDPPWLPTRILVRSGELFGLTPGTLRTAISRMAAAGELVADGDGYRLAGPLLDRQARQAASRTRRPAPRWDGRWEMAVVTVERRDASARTALRDAMRRLGLAEWREGVWLRPANLPADREESARAVVQDQCRTLTAVPDDEPVALAGELWDLRGWADTATDLAGRLARLVGPLEEGPIDERSTAVLAEGFVVSAAVLRHLVADPSLPPALLPADWPGPSLREDYDRYDRAFKSLWRAWFRAQD